MYIPNTVRCPHCGQVTEAPPNFVSGVVRCDSPSCRKEFEADAEDKETQPNENGASDDDLGESVKASTSATPFTHESQEKYLAAWHTPSLRRHPFRFAAFVGLIALGVFFLILAAIHASVTYLVLGIAAGGIGGSALGVWMWKAKSRTLAITSTSLIINDETKTPQVQEIHLDHISKIDIYQPWSGKVLNTGALEISWGNGEEETVYLDAVDQPHTVVETIRNHAANH